MANKTTKMLEKAAEQCGFGSVDDMLSEATLDTVAAGICLNCDAITDCCEPDATSAWCAHCGKRKVQSVLVIAGVI